MRLLLLVVDNKEDGERKYFFNKVKCALQAFPPFQALFPFIDTNKAIDWNNSIHYHTNSNNKYPSTTPFLPIPHKPSTKTQSQAHKPNPKMCKHYITPHDCGTATSSSWSLCRRGLKSRCTALLRISVPRLPSESRFCGRCLVCEVTGKTRGDFWFAGNRVRQIQREKGFWVGSNQVPPPKGEFGFQFASNRVPLIRVGTC
jgi:hypothetical protein